MAYTYQATDWDQYRMEYAKPHRELEPLSDEIAVVDSALSALRDAGVLPHNSVNAAERLKHYLAFVRDTRNSKASVNVIIDIEGLEVSVK